MKDYGLKRLGLFCSITLFVFLFTDYDICSASEAQDLISLASGAYWHDAEKGGLWGNELEGPGTAKIWTEATGEDGETYARVLFTHPRWTHDGWIHGLYKVTIPADNPVLVAKVGFLDGAEGTTGARAYFTYYNKATDKWVKLTQDKMIYYDGKFDIVIADLSSLAGKAVDIALIVETAGDSGCDWVIWSDIVIISQGSGTIAHETKHELIFLVADQTDSQYYWDQAMTLDDPCIDVSFNIAVHSYEDPDKKYRYIKAMEDNGYSYYVIAGNSQNIFDLNNDGLREVDTKNSIFLDPGDIWEILKEPNIKGLYFAEAFGGTVVKVQHAGWKGDFWAAVRKTFEWDIVEDILKCVKDKGKILIWDGFLGNYGWSSIRQSIAENPYVEQIWENYGDIIVPTWRNNVDKINYADFADFEYIKNTYCVGKEGASIQDWHWEAVTRRKKEGSLDVPAWDIKNYIKMNYDRGGSYSQFEYRWDKHEFFQGIKDGKDYICSYDDNGLVAHWRFDSEGDIDGYIYGAQRKNLGKRKAFYFDGVDDYIKFPDSPFLRLRRFTIAGWINVEPGRPKGACEWTNIVSEQISGADRNYVVYIYNPTGTLGVSSSFDGAGSDILSTTRVNNSRWHYFTYTYDGSEQRLYINGKLENRKAVSGIVYTQTADLIISPEHFRFRGLIDELKIWDRALTPAYILNMYKEDYNRYKPTPIPWSRR